MSPAPEDKAALAAFFVFVRRADSPCPLGRNLVNLVNFSFRIRYRFSLPFGQRSCKSCRIMITSRSQASEILEILEIFLETHTNNLGNLLASERILEISQIIISDNSWSISGNSCLSLLLASEQENREEVAFCAKQKNAF